jgi:hypothetical protein
MSRLRASLYGGLLIAPLVFGGANATPIEVSPDQQDNRTERELKEGVENILRAFDKMLRAMPRYTAPEMQNNGDIIIRRKPSRPPWKNDTLRDDEAWT